MNISQTGLFIIISVFYTIGRLVSYGTTENIKNTETVETSKKSFLQSNLLDDLYSLQVLDGYQSTLDDEKDWLENMVINLEKITTTLNIGKTLYNKATTLRKRVKETNIKIEENIIDLDKILDKSKELKIVKTLDDTLDSLTIEDFTGDIYPPPSDWNNCKVGANMYRVE